MQVMKVSLMRRRNLGNYEHIESAVEVGLTEGECSNEAILLARGVLNVALGLEKKPAAVAPKKEVKKEVKVAEVVKNTKVVNDFEVKDAPVVEEKPKKKVVAKKKVAKKVKAEVVPTTKEEVLNSLRAYAQAKKSKDMAQNVMEDVTGVKTLAEVAEKDYKKLVKALEVK